MANTQVITDAPVRSILISLAHSLSLLLFSRGNRTLYRGEEKWGKKERGRSVWAEQCSTRRWCENARERAKRTRANERGKRSVQHYRVRFSVVFRRSFLMHSLSLHHRRRRAHHPHHPHHHPHRSPSLLARIVTSRERSRIYRYV